MRTSQHAAAAVGSSTSSMMDELTTRAAQRPSCSCSPTHGATATASATWPSCSLMLLLLRAHPACTSSSIWSARAARAPSIAQPRPWRGDSTQAAAGHQRRAV
jgi:hypothetical protein